MKAWSHKPFGDCYSYRQGPYAGDKFRGPDEAEGDKPQLLTRLRTNNFVLFLEYFNYHYLW